MNKEEILSKLNKLALDKNKIIIISGASLVCQDIIDSTNDIDLSCSLDYYNQIAWNKKVGAYNTEIKYHDVFEIGPKLYYPDEIIIIDGYKFMNIERCLIIKEELNREKDKEVIKKIRRLLQK